MYFYRTIRFILDNSLVSLARCNINNWCVRNIVDAKTLVRSVINFRKLFHRLYLIEYEVLPLLPPEGLVVLDDQLVRCDADVERVRLRPALQQRESNAG